MCNGLFVDAGYDKTACTIMSDESESSNRDLYLSRADLTPALYPSATYPVFFFSHGSTAMLQSRTAPAAYWEEVGRQALEQGVERIVMMGAHWETTGETLRVSGNPNPPKQPVAW